MATATTETLARRWHEETANAGAQELALAPLVDKIAYGLARGLVVAIKELENHIGSETRKVSDSVGVRLDALQASFQELSNSVSELRARQATEIAALHTKTDQLSASTAERIDGLSKDLGVQQEDIAGIKSNFAACSSRMDMLTE